jgi:streptomycin 6-kinase
MIEVPQRLRTLVESDPAGPAWLDALPGLVDACLDEWRLTFEELLPASFSWVARVRRADGTPAVLKLTAPDSRELLALRLWDGDGAVRLLAGSEERSALLLELVEPGEPLTTLPVDEALRVAVGIGRRLWRELDGGHPFETVAERVARELPLLEEDYAKAPDACERAQLDDALAILASPPPGSRLLHGDLHTGNIRSSHREPWLALDPGPAVGDPSCELGWLLIDPHRVGEEAIPDARELERRLGLIVSESGADADAIRRWAFARATTTGVFTSAVGATLTAAHMLACARALR